MIRKKSYKSDYGIIHRFDGKTFRFSLYSYDDDRETAYLSDVYVKPSERGHRLGNKILYLAEMEAKKRNYTTICLKVLPNTWMYDWYKRHGYSNLSYNDGKYVWIKKEIRI